jgi:HAD superfamily hydrolase (TIGR01509 family)
MMVTSNLPPLTDWAVIFDLDGLLADTEPVWTESSRILLARRGRVYDPTMKSHFMGRHPQEVTALMIQHYQLAENPDNLLQERLDILCSLYQQGLKPLPGARELVLALAQDQIPMSVASGSPRRIVKLVLKQLHLIDWLSQFVGSDEVEHGKPAPDLFLLAARRMSIAPSRCIVLEDSIAGVQAALNAKMKCIAVPGPETPVAGVAHAHRVVNSLLELSPTALLHVVKTADL